MARRSPLKLIALYDRNRTKIGTARLMPGMRHAAFVSWGDRVFKRVSTGAYPERYQEIKPQPVLALLPAGAALHIGGRK